METITSLANDFLSQSSIAVVGISSTKQSVANGICRKLRTAARTVYAVGKNTTSFENEACYPDLASLPGSVTGVFIATTPENAERVVDECIALRIPRVWMHNMGGTSVSSGSSVSLRAVQKCRENNIAVIPGACPMMYCENADTFHSCVKWFLKVTGKLKV